MDRTLSPEGWGGRRRDLRPSACQRHFGPAIGGISLFFGFKHDISYHFASDHRDVPARFVERKPETLFVASPALRL